MAGARTVDLNRVNLGPGPAKYRRLRLRRGLAEFNLRVIVSRSGTVNPNAEVFQRRFSPTIVLTTHRATAASLKKLRAVAAEVKICGATGDQFPPRAALAAREVGRSSPPLRRRRRAQRRLVPRRPGKRTAPDRLPEDLRRPLRAHDR